MGLNEGIRHRLAQSLFRLENAYQSAKAVNSSANSTQG